MVELDAPDPSAEPPRLPNEPDVGMARLIADKDWSSSPLGFPDQWPQNLKATIGIMLPAAAQIVLFWGPEFVALYNDAYAPTIGDKHPRALGRPANENWSELWSDLGPLLTRVRETGETIHAKDRPFYIERHGYPETVYFDISYSPVLDDKGAVGGVLCIVSETTDQIIAQQRLSRVLETDAVGIIFFDHDGVVVDANEAFLQMTGYGRDEISRGELNWRRMTPDEWVSESQEQMEKLAATGKLGPYEKQYILADGSRRWMLFAGRDLGDGTIAEYCVDVTSSRQTSQALRESEARYRGLVSASNQVLYRHSADWSEMRQLAGGGFLADTAQPDADWFRKYIHPDDQPLVWKKIEEAIQSKSLFEMEHRVIREDGTLGWTLSRSIPILDEQGEIIEWFGAASDTTDRKRAEEALTALNETLEHRVVEEIERRSQAEEVLRQAQKMETVGQLSGGIAHDFNNLLQIIHGNLSMIERSLDATVSNAKLRRSVANALTGTERAAALTRRLLAFSRRQPLEARPVDVNRLITDMTEMLQRTLGETILVQTHLAHAIPNALVDGNQLENALLNLAINARDEMPQGGRLDILTSIANLDERALEDQPEGVFGHHVRIEVRDSGSGMTDEVKSRAVEPFFSTKEVGQGTGLGLSMVYGFVRQSGGHLVLNSRVGEGTTIELYLPCTDAAAEDRRNFASSEKLPSGRGERVLLCEDDKDVRFFSSETLRDLGYEVIEAQDANSALAALVGHGRIDLLFTDVVLPQGKTGADLAREARKLQPDLKVLFTTGYAKSALDREQRSERGVQVLLKPFGVEQLAAKVRQMLS